MSIAVIEELLARLHFPGDPQSRKELALGLAVRYFNGQWGGIPAGVHLNRLMAAIENSQYCFFTDAVGRTVGFVSWAMVSPALSQSLLRSGPAALAPADWRSGDELWVIDFSAVNGSLRHILAALRDHLFAQAQSATYFRYKGRTRLVKQVSRHDRTSFFASAGTPPCARGPLTPRDEVLHGRLPNLVRAGETGASLTALRFAPVHMQAPLSATLHLVGESLALRQLRLYRTEDGAPAGLLAWAWLSERTIARIAQAPLHQLNTAEWNEGGILCLWLASVSAPVFDAMEADIHTGLFPEEQRILLYVPASQHGPAHVVDMDRSSQAARGTRWLRQAGAGHA